MPKEELLSYSKKLLRQSNTNAFDEEIRNLIDACLIDMDISAVDKLDEIDPMVKRAVGIYVKANFGFENPDREGLIECYNSLKTHLAISNKYGQVLDHEKTSRS